jgi:quinol-cytochrome oxidoreductase complex cytochrome b subunit
MLHAALAILAAEAEPSKTAYYIAGGIFAAYAVVLGVLGATRPNFPANGTQAKGVMALSATLMALTMAMAVVTS